MTALRMRKNLCDSHSFRRFCRKETVWEKRFRAVLEEGGFTGVRKIYVDTVTGVSCLFAAEGYAGGLPPCWAWTGSLL